MGRRLPPAPLLVPAGLAVAYVLVPVAALVGFALSTGALVRGLEVPVAGQAVRLTVLTSTVTALVAVAVGTPLGYALARWRFPGKGLVEAAVELPVVLPPVVAGVALLVTFGRRGVLGPALGALGVEVPFTTAAVVLAQLFVAGPLYVVSARLGFAAVPDELLEAASLDGATPWRQFRTVALPLAAPALVSGAILCWARAASEFGATLLFAGSLPGRTQTLALAIVAALESTLDAALGLSVLLLGVSGAVLAGLRALSGPRTLGAG